MAVPELLELLRQADGGGGQLLHVEEVPGRPGTTVPWPSWADDDVVAGYRRLGVDRPWTHQVEAADAVWHGQHTVLATSTGSGKSLAAWLPAISAVREAAADAARPSAGRISGYSRRPTTLYLAPTKALAADQLAGLDRLLAAAQLRGVRASTCDGDTPLGERDWVREHADIVLSNPDFLHFSMLPGHRRWQRLLRGLRFLVIDECHAYRGVLGAHVALVVRRLLRLARHYGAEPTVILASATTGDPAGTAARLIGSEDVRSVTRDTAPSGTRTIVLWQPALTEVGQHWPAEGTSVPDVEDPAPGAQDDGPRRSVISETGDVLARLVRHGARTLAFVRSRYGTEAVAEQVRSRLVGTGLVDRVAAYRGGYLPEERRALETALRTGDLLALATTNALELGVDVAGLDAVVIAGWPGTRVSMWQQAGRSGRAGRDGLAVLIASDNPLDAYLVHHPEAIFGQSVEATTFDPANPYVLAPHLCAAAAELPITGEDLTLFGLPDETLLDELARRELLRRRPAGWYWNFARPEHPASLTDLRGGQGQPVQVVEGGTGTVLGTVDASRADATVHPGAVYIHQGQSFVVGSLEDDVALVSRDVELAHRTRARSQSSVRIVNEADHTVWQAPTGQVRWSYGQVEVTSRVTGFERRRLPDLDLIGSYDLDLPEHHLATTAVWWSASAADLEAVGVGADVLPGALHAAEHAAIGLLPIVATCDRWDLGGLSTALHPDTEQPTVFVHDAYPGGAGFAERGFRAARHWLTATLAAVAECSCPSGCPSCVQSPKCGNNNSPLDKVGAIRLLEFLVAACPDDEVSVPGPRR